MSIAIWVIVIVLVVVLIVIDIVLVSDRVEDNTFSELLRLGGKVSTFFPWTIGVLIGRWYHPVDDLKGVFGPFSIPVVMVFSYVIVVVGDIMQKRGRPIPAWIIVLVGMVAGGLCVPVSFEHISG